MGNDQTLVTTFYKGWHDYQQALVEALATLSDEQLGLHVGSELRSVQQIARHIIGARARWFYMLMGEGGEAFQDMGGWDRPDAPQRSAAELIEGLQRTWDGMHEAIARWNDEQWQQTWPGDEDEPTTLTRQWVIWHLIEHDLHHGGEISLTLGAHDLEGVAL